MPRTIGHVKIRMRRLCNVTTKQKSHLALRVITSLNLRAHPARFGGHRTCGWENMRFLNCDVTTELSFTWLFGWDLLILSQHCAKFWGTLWIRRYNVNFSTFGLMCHVPLWVGFHHPKSTTLVSLRSICLIEVEIMAFVIPVLTPVWVPMRRLTNSPNIAKIIITCENNYSRYLFVKALDCRCLTMFWVCLRFWISQDSE